MYATLNSNDTATKSKALAKQSGVIAESTRTMQRAKQTSGGDSEKNKSSWAKIDWYVKKFEELNPGSKASVEVDAQGVFKSCCFILSPIVDVMRRENAGVPSFSLDATFMKESSGYKGVIYVLVGRTSENTVSHASKRMRIS